MAYNFGNVSNFNELLTNLTTFLTTNSWISLKDSGVDNDHEIFFHNPDQDVVIGFKEYRNNSGVTPYNNLRLNVCNSYNSTLDFYSQDGSCIDTSASQPAPILTLAKSEMKYWFFVNNRRLIIVVYAEETYSVAYLGKFLPNGTPTQYPRPYLCGGSGYLRNGNLSSNSVYFMNFMESYNNNSQTNHMCHFKDHLSNWQRMRWSGSSSTTRQHTLFPDPYSFYYSMQDDDVVCAYPIQIFSNEYMLGEVDGIYQTDRFSVNSENIATIDGQDYIAFPHIMRTNDFKSFYLIKIQ